MTTDLLASDPRLTQQAIEQAEAEQAEAEKRLDIVEDLSPPDPVVAGRRAASLSYARRLIIARCVQSQEEMADDDALMVAVYVLFESDIHRLHRLSRKPEKMIDAAVALAETTSPEDYELMAQHAQTRLARLSAAQEIGGSGAGESEAGGPEKNAES